MGAIKTFGGSIEYKIIDAKNKMEIMVLFALFVVR
jgi:hypothetical protein